MSVFEREVERTKNIEKHSQKERKIQKPDFSSFFILSSGTSFVSSHHSERTNNKKKTPHRLERSKQEGRRKNHFQQ